ncbi:MAG: glycine--tRNA ligase subunit beta, partial [Fimbriimonadaceae bacterium]
MPNLLFELGCEEMPASAVDRATQDFLDQVTNRLIEAGLSFANARVLGTPRRIILGIEGISEQQPDRQEEMRGPRVQAAFDSSGNPTKALEGFCKGQGINPSEVT